MMDLVAQVKTKSKEVPICEKILLTIEEAVQYSNIGRDKLYQLCNEDGCKFVLKNGRNTLIKRKKFETFLDEVGFI